ILPTEREVINYFRLVEDLPTGDFDVSPEDLRLLHQEYFRDVPLENEARPGHWKDRDNVVATPWRTLKTSPKERAEQDLKDLLSSYNGTRGKFPLVARVAVFFHGFQRIHPFGDGNGRLGRLAALTLLSGGGLEAVRYAPMDDAINEDRNEYYLALARGDEGDLEYWTNYFGAQLHSGYQRAHLLARRLQQVPPKVPESSRRLLERLYIHRVATFRLADVRDAFLDESRRTVIRRLAELEGLGFLLREGQGAGSKYRVLSLPDAVKRSTSA
ncbi:MAG: Fic family protein, partial [Methanobacteriota archaeon]